MYTVPAANEPGDPAGTPITIDTSELTVGESLDVSETEGLDATEE